MSDVVVTVPMNFSSDEGGDLRGLDAWCAEGDAAGDPPTGKVWAFSTRKPAPKIAIGERVYVVCEGRLRGFSPLVDIRHYGGQVLLIRGAGAVAVTIPGEIVGFRGWRFRWWDRDDEIPFPDWRTADRRNAREKADGSSLPGPDAVSAVDVR